MAKRQLNIFDLFSKKTARTEQVTDDSQIFTGGESDAGNSMEVGLHALDEHSSSIDQDEMDDNVPGVIGEKEKVSASLIKDITDVQAEVDLATSSQSVEIDVALMKERPESFSEFERSRFLISQFIPPLNFQWPYSERMDSGKLRRKYLGSQHFRDTYSVFTYSLSLRGVFCKFCAMFAPEIAGGVKLDRLVKTPLQKYTHLTGRDGYLTQHVRTSFHEDCAQRAKAFLESVCSGRNVAEMLDLAAAAAERERNRIALSRIIIALTYHGRLGIALWGHRDSGELNVHEINYDQGNFRATLQLMINCNDKILKNHFQSAAKNATYISPGAQNSLITAIGKVIERDIVNEVKEATFFSLLADETTDNSGFSQLCVCLRYVNKNKLAMPCIYERYLRFARVTDLTGSGLSDKLLSIVEKCGLDKACMVGQGYDGAAAMSGIHNGVQKHILDECPVAFYFHCAAHSLNLCLSKAGEIPEIRTAVTLMNEIAVFFSESNKRLTDLQDAIEEVCPESSRTRLKKHCATRWVERQEAVSVFKELLPAVLHSLERISNYRAGDSGSKASIYLKGMDGSFYVALESLIIVLEITRPLSVAMQGKFQDIYKCSESVKDCITVLTDLRSEESFSKVFTEAGDIFGDEIQKPRLSSRQTHRSNTPAATAEEYYRRSVFYPFIDTCISQLQERFQKQSEKALQMCRLLPSLCVNATDVRDIGELYCAYLKTNQRALEAEFLRWKSFWKRQAPEEIHSDVLLALNKAEDLKTYPIIASLLKILATLPVTTATGERSFSSLKYIKNYLRSTMSESRFNGLAHMFINRDIEINNDAIIDEFGKEN